MSDKTKIQWTDATWNPVTGCTAVSPGCANCYAAKLAATRLKKQPRYAGLAVMRDGTPRWTGEVRLHEDKLAEPLRWRKPKKVFVCDMADLFHKDVPFEFIDRVFAVMALCPHITFQLLTKRPERMAEYLAHNGFAPARGGPMRDRVDVAAIRIVVDHGVKDADGDRPAPATCQWPLPNVWLGTSVENQSAADERIPHLLACPAAVRGLSVEPLIGPVDLVDAWYRSHAAASIATSGWKKEHVGRTGIGVDWVIVGGESGKKARPCNVAWIRSIVQQCKSAGVACFVKQLGANVWAEVCGRDGSVWPDGTMLDGCSECVEQIPGLRAITRFSLRDSHGGDPAEWPEDLRVREFPGA